jgi:hypothetical protein
VDIIAATKTKEPDGTYSVSGTTTFTLPSDQVIEWQASYLDSPPAGNDYYLHRSGQPLNEIPLSTSLNSGPNAGTHFLNAGTYEISITYFGMGAGSYAIKYNRTASIGVSPTNHNFGAELEGDSSSPVTFTINSTGDVVVTISSIISSDPACFEILAGAPIGQQVPPNKTFQVRFNAGTTPGTFAANITISGTSDLGPVSASATVTGTTLPTEANIQCAGNPNIGSADWFIGEVKTLSRSFQNTGTADLVLTAINLVNDTAADVFTFDGAPSLEPVLPSGSRSVAIRFAPPMAGGEAVYSGHLVIQSNDPDEPVAQCSFHATAHHPVPVMRLESTTLDYREVELGFAFTKAIVIHNDGDVPLQVSVTNISGDDPDLVHYSLNEGSASVNPGAQPAIFREVYEPQAIGGPHTIQMRATGNDLTNPIQDVSLAGEGIAPVPIDSALVLDRSGSMAQSAGQRRKIDALQTAADLYAHLLRPEIPGTSTGDKIGFVRYNHTNDIYLSLDLLDDPAIAGSHLADAEDKLSDAAIADVTRLGPDGSTGIGGAIQTAAGMVVGSPVDRKHVMVVLTDGKENREPWIRTVIGPVRAADPDLMMYSVGLGSSIEPDKLQEITNTGNGYHQVVDDLSGITVFDLETFYFKIFSNATGMDLVLDPTHPVPLSGTAPVIVDTARIISSDRSATFLVLENPALRGFYDLELVDPSGHVIVLGSTIGGIPVHRLQRYNYTIYRVIFPALEQAPAYAGDWVLRLTTRGEWSAKTVAAVSANPQSTATAYIDPYKGLAPIGFAAAVASNYRLAVQVLPSGYRPGADVMLTASLSDRGWPTVNGQVEVDVTTPSGVEHTIRLYDDGTHADAERGDGTWTNRFFHTGESGSYKFHFRAIGENERGELAPREATRYLTLMQPSKDPVARPCLPCWLERLLWVVVVGLLSFILLLLIILVRRGFS